MNAQQISWLPEEVRNHIAQLERDLARLTAENERLENLTASGIHTCNADCQRPMCVLRRERDKAHADLARVTAERDNARAQALADRAFQSDNAALRARNAELVAALDYIAKWVEADGADEKYDREILRVCAIARSGSATPAVIKESLTTESATPATHPDTVRLATLLESALKSFAAMPEANPSHTRDGIWALWTDGCNTLRDAIAAARKQEASK